MAIEIVDFPINSMVIFNSYVSLPEGNWMNDGILIHAHKKGGPLDARPPGAIGLKVPRWHSWHHRYH